MPEDEKPASKPNHRQELDEWLERSERVLTEYEASLADLPRR